ncbi:hypothetical protein PR003_g23428 [Phytophthora rubi]|uniref:Uncharacterized protein n=1 Tax=Phytophthora rubi TaxID=129364 RepID=A0A6A3HYD7_9STRA|nr:hypothetical protein PR002_g25558 [Phytophthora rubi]KAE9297711.1 hypothetical protein PR003_g23428 [Phytophthora rubi]
MFLSRWRRSPRLPSAKPSTCPRSLAGHAACVRRAWGASCTATGGAWRDLLCL